MHKCIIFLALSISSFAQMQFASSSSFSLDSVKYETVGGFLCGILAIDHLPAVGTLTDPLGVYLDIGPYTSSRLSMNTRALSGYKQKGITPIDIVQITKGVIATINVPQTVEGKQFEVFLITQYVFDNDPGWEVIGVTPTDSGTFNYYLLDDNGSIVLKLTRPHLYYDADYSYLVDITGDMASNKFTTYKFSSNSALKMPINHSSYAPVSPIVDYMPSGRLNISLSANKDGSADIRLFNLLGKLIYSKKIADLNAPVTITIPKEYLPHTPVITNITTGNNTFIDKLNPVK